MKYFIRYTIGSTLSYITVNDVSFKMVKVEGGTFKMGTTPNQGEVMVNQPVHEVTVGTFYIGETEVTQGLWNAVMGTSPSTFQHTFSAITNKFPVENVSLQEYKEFLKQLNKLTGRKFRLPSEDEWEYAARGDKKAKPTRFAGSNNIEEVGWYAQNSGKKHLDNNWRREELRENECKPQMVAEKAPNELGIYDMTGNVCEWTDTKYTRSNYKSERNKYVLKGGAYDDNIINCAISRVGVLSPKGKFSNQGLRLALSE